MSGTTTATPQNLQPQEPQKQYKWRIIWRCFIVIVLFHITGLYGIYLCFSAPWKTLLYSWILLIVGLQGMTAGAHRYWSHKAFKANLPLRIILIIFHTLSLQTTAYDWAKFHRVHHKYVDTDADPHNSRRGFFFSHIGWLLLESEPEVEEKYKGIDYSDLHSDKVLMAQKNYYYTFFVPIIGIAIPTLIPWYFWGDTIENSFFIAIMLKYTLCCHFTFLINSLAHSHGTKPYDNTIRPTENMLVSIVTGGEGWHNYHHVFPWDYKAGEWGNRINWTALFIESMAAIGWAYDLKATSPEMIMARVQRTGDGTRKIDRLFSTPMSGHDHGDDHVWGWGDKDMTEEDYSYVKIHNSKSD